MQPRGFNKRYDYPCRMSRRNVRPHFKTRRHASPNTSLGFHQPPRALEHTACVRALYFFDENDTVCSPP